MGRLSVLLSMGKFSLEMLFSGMKRRGYGIVGSERKEEEEVKCGRDGSS